MMQRRLGLYFGLFLFAISATVNSAVLDLNQMDVLFQKDFGNVSRTSSPLTWHYTFRNSSGSSLTFIGINKSCSCTTATINAARIEVGEEFTVSVSIDIKNAPGSIEQGADFIFDRGTLRLEGKAFVTRIAQIIKAPKPVEVPSEMGQLLASVPTSADIIIYRSLEDSVINPSIHSMPPYLTFTDLTFVASVPVAGSVNVVGDIFHLNFSVDLKNIGMHGGDYAEVAILLKIAEDKQALKLPLSFTETRILNLSPDSIKISCNSTSESVNRMIDYEPSGSVLAGEASKGAISLKRNDAIQYTYKCEDCADHFITSDTIYLKTTSGTVTIPVSILCK